MPLPLGEGTLPVSPPANRAHPGRGEGQKGTLPALRNRPSSHLGGSRRRAQGGRSDGVRTRANVRAAAGRMRRVSVSVPPSPDHSANHSMHTSICAGMALHTQSSIHGLHIRTVTAHATQTRELLHTLHTTYYTCCVYSILSTTVLSSTRQLAVHTEVWEARLARSQSRSVTDPLCHTIALSRNRSVTPPQGAPPSRSRSVTQPLHHATTPSRSCSITKLRHRPARSRLGHGAALSHDRSRSRSVTEPLCATN